MTVLENIIEAPVRVRGTSRTEAKKRAAELLAQVGVPEKADAYPIRLSGGSSSAWPSRERWRWIQGHALR